MKAAAVGTKTTTMNGKDGDISDDDDAYAFGVNGVGKTLDKGNDQCCPQTSMPCKSAANPALTLREYDTSSGRR
jgi:hypothetical protein